MKTYKQFNEAAALALITEGAVLALPALKAAPYVIPALGAGANILKGMMKSDASDRFKARQRGGRLTPGEAQRRQSREDRRAEAKRRARENTPKRKEVEPNVQTPKKPEREKVDPALERAAGQILDRLRNESVLPTTGAGKEKAVQKGLEKLNSKYTKMYNDVNSVPKDRGKA